VDESKRKYHEISNLFPLLQGTEFEALKADIQANGLFEPIILHPDGSILDGRNRHRACVELGIEPRFKTWSGEGSLVMFVVSMNVRRRHLTSGQCAVIALEILPILEKENEEIRRKKISIAGSTSKFEMNQLIDSSQTVMSTEQAAEILQTNRQYVSDAKKLKENAPDLLEQVRTGEKTIPQAKKELRKRKHKSGPVPKVSLAIKSPLLIVAKAENMPQIADESIDLIITSPPYNLGAKSWPMGGEGRTPREHGIGYDDAMAETDYQKWQVACLKEMYRVARLGASLFYNHKVRIRDGIMLHPMEWLLSPDNPWLLRQEIIWDRGNTHNHCASLFWPHDERIYWMTKGKPVLPDHPIGLPTIWQFHGPIAGTWHPAPFSEKLPRMCIEAVGREGITVLDPFAGSCTTLKVALEYGYNAIGVDVCADYLEHAREENGWTKKSKT